jgi:hypothetical protein
LLIRHCVEQSNTDENWIIKDPTKIRHAVIVGGRIKSMSGLIDPASHLNLDYPDHKVTACAIVEKFEIGAKAIFSERGIAFANVDARAAFDHYGYVDYTQRLSDMIEAVKKKKNKEAEEKKVATMGQKESKRGEKC